MQQHREDEGEGGEGAWRCGQGSSAPGLIDVCLTAEQAKGAASAYHSWDKNRGCSHLSSASFAVFSIHHARSNSGCPPSRSGRMSIAWRPHLAVGKSRAWTAGRGGLNLSLLFRSFFFLFFSSLFSLCQSACPTATSMQVLDGCALHEASVGGVGIDKSKSGRPDFSSFSRRRSA